MLDIHRDKWQWTLREPDILDPWFKDHAEISEEQVVKKNPARTVFHCGDYFVKLDTPEKPFHKLRSLLRPKAKVEFDTALQLEQQSVPEVEHLGWGRCGSSSILITRAFTNSVTMLEYVFNSLSYNNKDKTPFVRKFAVFLKNIFDAGCYHKDFHPGNILYNPTDKTFALIDVYAVKVKRNIPLLPEEKIRMCGILTSLNRFLSDTEAAKFIVDIQLENNLQRATHIWHQLLENAAKKTMEDWPKRKKQILRGYEKFVTIIQDHEGEYIFLHNPVRQPLIAPLLPLKKVPEQLTEVKLPFDQAEKLWLRSFLMDFLEVSHHMPLVWHRPYTGIESSLYFPVTEFREPEPEQLQLFIARSGIAGINLDHFNKFGVTENGRIVCTTIP